MAPKPERGTRDLCPGTRRTVNRDLRCSLGYTAARRRCMYRGDDDDDDDDDVCLFLSNLSTVAVPRLGLGHIPPPPKKKMWLGPRFSRILASHCGQLILRKLVNFMSSDVRF